MTIYSIIFYVLALLILVSTLIAVTRRNLVHAVIYIVFSFFGSAMLFYLLGAPLLAALEIIIYAGAVMVLFLFIIMMLQVKRPAERRPPFKQWLPAACIGIAFLILAGAMVSTDPTALARMPLATTDPAVFGNFLFRRHWLSIEIASYLLLIVLVGALFLGKEVQRQKRRKSEDAT